jgi:hypothetical protein
MMRSDTSLGRRLIFPLLIVGIAMAFALWTTQGGGAKGDVVERFIRQLCVDAAQGRSTRDQLALSDPTVAEFVDRRIADICAAQAGQTETIAIEVIAGDIHPHPGSEIATHSALVGDGSVDMLGLRVSCNGSGAVRVLGYWIPPSR